MGAVFLLALPVAACSGGSSDPSGSETGSAPASSTPSSSPPPTVSPAAYEDALSTALGPLDHALRVVDRAGQGAALDRALVAASRAAATSADEVGAVRTPDDAITGTMRFSEALRDLGDALTAARGDGSRCATSPRVELGSGTSIAAVKDARTTLSGLGYKVPLTVPRTAAPQHRRLGNGHFVKDSGRSGLGRLSVDNDTSSDAVISLTRGGSTTFMVYVRKHGKTTVRGVRNGTYTVYFTTGSDWDSAKKSFTRNCAFRKFDDKAHFRTTSVAGGTQYDILTFSLGLTPFGNATTSDVPANKFPS